MSRGGLLQFQSGITQEDNSPTKPNWPMAQPAAHDEPGEVAAVPRRPPQQQRAGFRFLPDLARWWPEGNLSNSLAQVRRRYKNCKKIHSHSCIFSLYCADERCAYEIPGRSIRGIQAGHEVLFIVLGAQLPLVGHAGRNSVYGWLFPDQAKRQRKPDGMMIPRFHWRTPRPTPLPMPTGIWKIQCIPKTTRRSWQL